MSRIFNKLLEPTNDDPDKFTKNDAIAIGIAFCMWLPIIGLACIMALVASQ